MVKRSGSAVWTGDLKSGKGTISTESGILDDATYGFRTRFENEPGTNPEELIGAAHAGCFSMAFSKALGDEGLTPERIETKADVTLDQVEGGFAISRVHLTTNAKVPGADQATFDKIANAAKEGCPVSKLFTAEISLDATLD
ncbi:MAG: OsmC family protein [Pseudomonadota bacterium]